MERKYEYGKENHQECKHDLHCVKSCRECLFNVLCHLEISEEERAKQEG